MIRFSLVFLSLAGVLAAAPAPRPEFAEVWAYLAPGAEATAANRPGVTDWAFFGATLDSQGDLAELPNPLKLSRFPGRRHLVVAVVDNFALTHMAVTKAFPVREALLDRIAAAAGPYDGVQLDFEAVTTRDRADFWTFCADLKARIGARWLSLAVPARTKVVDDSFPYAKLAAIADRLIVMAYDEHWSSSRPGPVASLDWGEQVAAWARRQIGAEKLIMGAPFYGRSWAERALSRAHTFASAAGLLRSKGLESPRRSESVPYFEYDETVHVRLYYEDRISQEARLARYASAGVRKVAFWRVGQEDPSVWSLFADQPVPLLWPRDESFDFPSWD